MHKRFSIGEHKNKSPVSCVQMFPMISAHSFCRKDYYHWIIQSGGCDVGFLNFAAYDPQQKETSWGFYLGEESARGIGGRIPPFFYNFAFDVLGVERIKVTVFNDNHSTLRLHLRQGYMPNPAENHIIQKNGKEILVMSVQLEKETFKKSKYRNFMAHFPIEKWQHKNLVQISQAANHPADLFPVFL